MVRSPPVQDNFSCHPILLPVHARSHGKANFEKVSARLIHLFGCSSVKSVRSLRLLIFFPTNFGNLWHKSWCVWERTTVSGSELVRLVESPKISEKCDCIILFCKTRPANFSHFFGQTVHSWLARLAFVTVSPNGKERFRWKAVWVSKGCFPSTQKCFEKACHTTLYV